MQRSPKGAVTVPEKMASEGITPWKAYESVSIPEMLKFIHQRWTWMYPFQRRVIGTFTLGEMIILVVMCSAFSAWFAVGLSASCEGTGSQPTVPFALTYATACHNSLLTFLIGLPFERALFWHKGLAYTSLVMTCLHGYICVFDESDGSFTGYVILGAASLMVLTSFYPIRRRFFEFFYYNHVVLLIICGLFCVIHGAGGVAYGMALWMADVAYRYYLSTRRISREVDIEMLPAKVIRVTFPAASFPRYKGGQYLFMCVPELGFFEWHPFSLSSSPHEKDISIHIRVLGNWTTKLEEIARRQEGPAKLRVFMEGPYGEPGLDLESSRYQCFLLVSGGIGITPMQSICNELLEQHTRGRPLSKVWFVWACRDKYMVQTVGGVQKPDGLKRLPLSFQPDLLHRHNSNGSISNNGDEEEGRNLIGTAGVGLSDALQGDEEEKASEDVVHTEFFLTKVRDKEGYADANIDPDTQDCLRFGRPNLADEIFPKLKAFAKKEGHSRVAVLTCGPTSLVEDVAKNCLSQSGEGVTFELHSETFTF